MRRLWTGAHRPCPLPSSRARCEAMAGQRPESAVGLSKSMTSVFSGVFSGIDPETYRAHALHSGERTWPETNCYVDLW
ncbi:DUF1839 family protein, partial [Rhizobium laguerreae]|uniref:DUF1839 family protein n=1 Tax=Rhizobium laguerreae TaxID=1076926 RepID=UPI001FEB287D